MKRFRVHPDETHYYYSTCTIIDWLPVFQSDPYFQIIIESLNYCRIHKGLYLLAYVIMPTHLHLVTSNEEHTTLSDIMRDFRQFTSRNIRKLLETDGRQTFLDTFHCAAEGRDQQEFKVWSDDFHPIALKSEQWIKQKIDYVHDNPVRKGFVELPQYWKYSSARNWLLDDEKVIKVDKSRLC